MLARRRRPISSTSAVLDFPLLTALVFLPAFGAVLAMLVPARRPELARAIGYVDERGDASGWRCTC